MQHKEDLEQENQQQEDFNGQEEENTPLVPDPEAPGHEAAELASQLAESQDKFLRLYSEFENFRRRTSRERIELIATANKDLILKILPVFDDFERAVGAINNAPDPAAAIEGVQLVFNKFKNTLEQEGLREIEAIGQPFDSEQHEAITQVPAPSPDMKGKIIDQIQKGYTMHDRLIRVAKVVVGV